MSSTTDPQFLLTCFDSWCKQQVYSNRKNTLRTKLLDEFKELETKRSAYQEPPLTLDILNPNDIELLNLYAQESLAVLINDCHIPSTNMRMITIGEVVVCLKQAYHNPHELPVDRFMMFLMHESKGLLPLLEYQNQRIPGVNKQIQGSTLLQLSSLIPKQSARFPVYQWLVCLLTQITLLSPMKDIHDMPYPSIPVSSSSSSSSTSSSSATLEHSLRLKQSSLGWLCNLEQTKTIFEASGDKLDLYFDSLMSTEKLSRCMIWLEEAYKKTEKGTTEIPIRIEEDLKSVSKNQAILVIQQAIHAEFLRVLQGSITTLCTQEIYEGFEGSVKDCIKSLDSQLNETEIKLEEASQAHLVYTDEFLDPYEAYEKQRCHESLIAKRQQYYGELETWIHVLSNHPNNRRCSAGVLGRQLHQKFVECLGEKDEQGSPILLQQSNTEILKRISQKSQQAYDLDFKLFFCEMLKEVKAILEEGIRRNTGFLGRQTRVYEWKKDIMTYQEDKLKAGFAHVTATHLNDFNTRLINRQAIVNMKESTEISEYVNWMGLYDRLLQDELIPILKQTHTHTEGRYREACKVFNHHLAYLPPITTKSIPIEWVCEFIRGYYVKTEKVSYSEQTDAVGYLQGLYTWLRSRAGQQQQDEQDEQEQKAGEMIDLNRMANDMNKFKSRISSKDTGMISYQSFELFLLDSLYIIYLTGITPQTPTQTTTTTNKRSAEDDNAPRKKHKGSIAAAS